MSGRLNLSSCFITQHMEMSFTDALKRVFISNKHIITILNVSLSLQLLLLAFIHVSSWKDAKQSSAKHLSILWLLIWSTCHGTVDWLKCLSNQTKQVVINSIYSRAPQNKISKDSSLAYMIPFSGHFADSGSNSEQQMSRWATGGNNGWGFWGGGEGHVSSLWWSESGRRMGALPHNSHCYKSCCLMQVNSILIFAQEIWSFQAIWLCWYVALCCGKLVPEVFGKKTKLTDLKSRSSAPPCLCVSSFVCLYHSITVVAVVCVMTAVCAYAGFEVKSSVKGWMPYL